MAPVLDAVGPSSSGASTGVQANDTTTLTWSHTVGTGGARYLIVGASAGSSAAGTGTMTATYGGVSMTLVGSVRSNSASGGFGKVYLFGLAAPASGTANVVITSSATATLSGGSTSWTGVGSVGTAVTNSGSSTTATVSVTGTVSGNVVVSHGGSGSAFTATSQTLRYRAPGNGGSSAGNSQGSTASSAGGTVSFTETTPNDDWGIVAVELKAATVVYNGSATNTSASSTASGTSTLTAAITPAVGDVLVVKAGAGDAKVTVTGVADTQGLTWTLKASTAATSTASAYIYTATATAATSTTVTVTFSNSSASTNYPRAISVERYTNASVGSATNTASGVTTTSSSITTTGPTGSVVTFIDTDWNGVTTGTPTYLGTATVTSAAYRPSTGCFYFAQQATTGAGSVTYGMSAPTGQKANLVAIELPVIGSGSTNYAGAATLAGSSSLSISGPSETAAAGTTVAGSSGTTAQPNATLQANAALAGSSGTTATASRGQYATVTTGSTSGTVAGATAGIGIVLVGTSGTTATAGAVEQAQATLTGASGLTAQAQLGARASATLSGTSGMVIGPFVTERSAATLAAVSGSTFTVFAVRFAAVTTGSTSGNTATARLGASVSVTLSSSSGLTANANPPDAPAAAVLAAVSSLSAAGGLGALGVSTLAAVSALIASPDSFTPPFVPPPGPVKVQVRNPRWRLLVFDTVTGRVGYEVPFSALSWSRKFNVDAGQMSATLPIESALTTISRTGADDPMVLFREFLTGPYRYSVAVAYGNVLVWAGPYLPAQAAADKPTVDIAAVEFAKLLDKRLMLNPAGHGDITDPSYDVSFGGTTLASIAYQIVMVATSGVGKQLPITCSAVPADDGLDAAAWNGYDLVSCWKALGDISSRDGGPDIRFDPYLYQGTNGDYVAYELRIGDPYIHGGPGADPDGGDLPWTWDETTATIQPDSDGSGMATSYYVPGSGQDRAKVIGMATRSTLLTYGFPVLEVVDGQHSSETSGDVLDSFALADVYSGSQPAITWTVSVPVEGDQSFGQYHPGDMARLDVDRNLLIAPDSYFRRITEVAGDGSAQVTLSVMDDEVPSAAQLIDDTATISIPQNLTATVDGGGSIHLDWDDVYGSSSYRIYETQSPQGVASVVDSQSVRGPFSDKSRTFTYWVTALVNGIESNPSNTVAITFGLGSTSDVPAYGVRFATGSVNEKMDSASYNWQSTSPFIQAGGGGYAGNTLAINMPANGVQNPGTGATANTDGGQRCEQQPDLTTVGGPDEFGPGDFGYFGLSFVLGAGFPITTTSWCVLTQMKNDGSGTPPFELKAGNGKLYLDGNSGGWSLDVCKVTTGVRYNVVIGLVFAESASDSVINVWVNGVQCVTNGHPVGSGILYSGIQDYWKFGIYKDASILPAANVNYGAVAYDATSWKAVANYLAATP